jgi:hypothetical protein
VRDNEFRGIGKRSLFIEKLLTVVEYGRLDYWDNRRSPPNLLEEDFKNLLNRVDTIEKFKLFPRKSEHGVYGKTGEDNCFKFEYEVQFGSFSGVLFKRYFVKGYFFEKEKLIGVTIQSFREV